VFHSGKLNITFKNKEKITVRKILTDCSTLITPFSQALGDEVLSSLDFSIVIESKGDVLEGKESCKITLSSLSCNTDARILKEKKNEYINFD
jgi:hypothetical protein